MLCVVVVCSFVFDECYLWLIVCCCCLLRNRCASVCSSLFLGGCCSSLLSFVDCFVLLFVLLPFCCGLLVVCYVLLSCVVAYGFIVRRRCPFFVC